MKKKSKRKTFNEAFMDQYRADYLTSLDLEPKVHVEVSPAYAGAMEATRKIRKRMEDEFKEQDKMVKEFLTKQDVQAKEPPKAASRPELKAMKLSESELSNKPREVNRKSLKESLSSGWTKDFEYLIDKYMPASGEGNTMASQAVTAVNKLVYKFYNDGDVFDNTHALEGWANDLSTYANWLLKFVPKSAHILLGIEDCYTEEDYEELLQDLAASVLDEKTLESLADQPKVSSIYNQKGHFKFVDRDDEEDEYEYEEDDDDFYESLKESASLNEDYSNFIGRPLKDFLNNIDSRTELSVDFENRDSTSGHSGFLGMAHQLPWYTADKIVKDIKLGDDRYYKFKVLTESKTLNESSIEDMIKAFENRIDELEGVKNESLKESGNTFNIKDQVQRYIVKELEKEIDGITAQEIAGKIKGYDVDWCPADITPLNTRLRNQINYHILVIAGALTKMLFEDAPEEIKESLKAESVSMDEWNEIEDEVWSKLEAEGYDMKSKDVLNFVDAAVDYIEMHREAGNFYSVSEWWKDTKSNAQKELDELPKLNESSNKKLEESSEDSEDEEEPDNHRYKVVAADEDENVLFIKDAANFTFINKALNNLHKKLPEGTAEIYVVRDDDKEIYIEFINEDGESEVILDKRWLLKDDAYRPSKLNKVISDLCSESKYFVAHLREIDRNKWKKENGITGNIGFDDHEMGFKDDVFNLSSPNMNQIEWAKHVADHYGLKYSEVTEGNGKYFIKLYAPGFSDDPLLGEL